ncbi:MAG TPA: ATP-binding protein [Caulobacterales bacterium]|nr:ATP-binding protein [Caulobacterales bacterium]
MRAPTPSIGLLLLSITGALTLMIAALSIEDLQRNMRRLKDLENLKGAMTVGDQLFSAAEDISLERDISIAMLSAPDVETARDLNARLAEARAATDPAVAAALAGTSRYRIEHLSELRASVGTRMQRIRGLRRETDAAIHHPGDARSRALVESWSVEVSGLLGDTEDLWLKVTKQFVHIDPIATLHLRFKHLLRSIRNQTAIERSLIGQGLSQSSGLSAQQIGDLLRAEGGAEADWLTSHAIAEQSGLFPGISRPYGDARSHFETLRDMTKSIYYMQGRRFHEAFPLGPAFWFELTTQAGETFQHLTDATVQASQAYVDTLMARARQTIAAQYLILALAILLCGASFVIVVGRVVRPINEIVGALLAATRGEEVKPATGKLRNDEIGKLAAVLEAFHENLARVRRSAIEVERSEQRLRAVVDNAMDGLITLDAQGAVKSFNPACERIFRRLAEDVVGKPITSLVPSLYAHGDHADLASYVAGPSGAGAHEATGRRPNGEAFPLDLTMSSYALDGAPYYLAIVRDVTQRKEAELALLGYTHALERSNKELDDFAYIASHDLKEPLRGIHNHARFLLEDNEAALDEDSAKRLHRLVYLSQRMERLVNDLLYFSRLGRQELAVQPMDMAAAVRDIETTLEHFLEERGARLVVHEDMPIAVCDKPRVTELLRNLITNAVKYNDKPEKVIEIGCVAAKGRHGGRLARRVYFVRDNGRGIAPEFHQDVFRIFKRLQAGEGAEEGTGVGLTFVKKIVERHGGEVWLESELGEGTTFYFTLEAPRDDSRLSPEAA